MEEMIRFIVLKNLDEVKDKDISLEGLCYYFANNIKADLEMMEIPVSIYSIGNGYRYYLLAGKDCEYLIDPSYSQFLPKEGEETILFEDFPASVLEKSERGKEILGNLLHDGYHKLNCNDMDIYLDSFRLKERKKHR